MDVMIDDNRCVVTPPTLTAAGLHEYIYSSFWLFFNVCVVQFPFSVVSQSGLVTFCSALRLKWILAANK